MPVNTYQSQFASPPYITFEETDWGMSIDEVLSVLNWEETDWEETTNKGDQKGGERRFLRKAVARYGGYVDIEFFLL